MKFVLLEDPAAKLAAFRKGDVDIMWNTVDNWAREASILAEQGAKAKSILLQDWSRGGDGIVSLASIKSIEDLKGKKVACTQFTPSHFLLLYLLSQSGLTPEDRAGVEKAIVFTQDAPAAAAMFKAKQVDAAVTWEPDLSSAVEARGDEAHVLVSTAAATNIIADTLCARQDLIDSAPETVRDFVHGWFDGIEMMKADPAGAYNVVGKALKLDEETVSGMLSGLKLTPYADNAQFYGLDGRQGALRDALRHGLRHLAEEGARHEAGRREGLGRHPLPRRARLRLPDAEGRGAEGRRQGAVGHGPGDHQQADPDPLHAEQRRDHAGLLLRPRRPRRDDDLLRQHLPPRRGEHRRDGKASANMQLSERRALAVKNYVLKNFPNIEAARFQTIGHGSANPVADNTTETGRQLNRRTDIKVVLATRLRAVAAYQRGLFALRAPLPKATALALGFVMPALVLAAWCVASYGGLAPADFLPSPTEVIRGTLQLFLQYDLFEAILVSTRRIALAFLLASAVALPLGILMGAFAPVNRLFEPIVSPLRYMPISAFIPLLILWFGIYEKQKIAFLFLGVFVYLLPVVVTAIRAVPEEYVQTALTLGASRGQVIRTVLLPAAAPEIFDSFRVMNAISWTYVILAEAVNPEHGLGYMVELARTHQKASWSFAGLLVIGGIGLLTDFLITTVSRLLFRWREASS